MSSCPLYTLSQYRVTPVCVFLLSVAEPPESLPGLPPPPPPPPAPLPRCPLIGLHIYGAILHRILSAPAQVRSVISLLTSPRSPTHSSKHRPCTASRPWQQMAWFGPLAFPGIQMSRFHPCADGTYEEMNIMSADAEQEPMT